MQTTKTTPKARYIEVSVNQNPQDPRPRNSWGILATIWHKPHPTVNLNTKDSFFPYEKNSRRLRPEVELVRPLYMLPGGNPRLSFTGFDNPDSVQLGLAFMTTEAANNMGCGEWLQDEEIEQNLDDDIRIMSNWLEGNVYQVDLFDEHQNNLFSLGGFYGKEDAQIRMPDRCSYDGFLPFNDATEKLIKRALNNIGTRIKTHTILEKPVVHKTDSRRNMMTISVERAAEWLITKSNQRHKPISILKLQKLLYFAQAWNLAFMDEPLFPDEFEAWARGPLIPKVFNQYRANHQVWEDLPNPTWIPLLDGHALELLSLVYDAYGPVGEHELEMITTSEAPWIEARGDLGPELQCDAVISTRRMKEFYENLYDESEKGETHANSSSSAK